jgi:hypothetical protein
VWYYNITVTVIEPPSDDDVVVLPEAAEVIELYDGRVYDLGNTTLEDVYSTATDDIESIDAATLIETFEINKIELIDLAAEQDQIDANLEELREQRDAEEEVALDEYLNDNGPPIPTVRGIAPDGLMTIDFSSPLLVPDDPNAYKDEEVAFRST